MADFLNEIADYMANATSPDIGTVATDIFIGELPGTPDNCVAIFGQPGSVIGDQREVASLQFPRFQVIIRNKDYDLGSAKLQDVRTKLHGKYGLMLPSWRVLRLHAEQEGGPIGSDDQNRFEFSINFVAELNAETTP